MRLPFFDATSIEIGMCASPRCRSVHIQLFDADGTARAQAVIACEDVDKVAADLKLTRDRILGGTASLERH